MNTIWVAEIWFLHPALSCYPQKLYAVHDTVGTAAINLGIGELQLQKKGLLLEMYLLAEIACLSAKAITPTTVLFVVFL